MGTANRHVSPWPRARALTALRMGRGSVGSFLIVIFPCVLLLVLQSNVGGGVIDVVTLFSVGFWVCGWVIAATETWRDGKCVGP